MLNDFFVVVLIPHFLFQLSKKTSVKLTHMSRKKLLLIATFYFVKLIKIGFGVYHD